MAPVTGAAIPSTVTTRVRSLVTIAAPLLPVGARQRWTQTYPLALVYRLTGPNRLITKALFDRLLGPDAIAAHPDRAANLIRSFEEADRESIRRTIRFMHRWQPLTETLPAITAPTLFLTGDLDDQHWGPAEARAAAATMPDARVVALTGWGTSAHSWSMLNSSPARSPNSGRRWNRCFGTAIRSVWRSVSAVHRRLD
jgi:pimeloyl-ACP methyl ester carboxylesterase